MSSSPPPADEGASKPESSKGKFQNPYEYSSDVYAAGGGGLYVPDAMRGPTGLTGTYWGFVGVVAMLVLFSSIVWGFFSLGIMLLLLSAIVRVAVLDRRAMRQGNTPFPAIPSFLWSVVLCCILVVVSCVLFLATCTGGVVLVDGGQGSRYGMEWIALGVATLVAFASYIGFLILSLRIGF